MATPHLHLSPAEVSRRLGIGSKALRLYEARGLVTPLRDGSGWRVFGPEQIARLHQVLALKAMRLSLGRISQLLNGEGVTLSGVLAAQESALAKEAAHARRALVLVRQARERLAQGVSLSIDDLTTLSKETIMTSKLTQEDLAQALDPHVRSHFSPAEIEETARRPFDQEKIGQDWDALIAEARGLMAEGDPTTPEALDLARRWKAQVEQFTRGDPGVTARVQAVWSDAMADPKTAPDLPLNPELFAFMGKAQDRLAEAGG